MRESSEHLAEQRLAVIPLLNKHWHTLGALPFSLEDVEGQSSNDSSRPKRPAITPKTPQQHGHSSPGHSQQVEIDRLPSHLWIDEFDLPERWVGLNARESLINRVTLFGLSHSQFSRIMNGGSHDLSHLRFGQRTTLISFWCDVPLTAWASEVRIRNYPRREADTTDDTIGRLISTFWSRNLDRIMRPSQWLHKVACLEWYGVFGYASIYEHIRVCAGTCPYVLAYTRMPQDAAVDPPTNRDRIGKLQKGGK
jgi:hypothetical protein